MPSLETSIHVGARLVIDSSALIAHLKGSEDVSPLATIIIDSFLGSARNDGVMSTITVGEVLVDPSRSGKARSLGMGILEMPGVQLRSVDFLVAAEAARMRAESSLRLPDAIVLATGVLTSATCLVTNDQTLAAAVPLVAPGLHVCLLSDHIPPSGGAASA